MHNKTFVFDDQLVFTGSYNFSENAEANDEVVLTFASEPLAAAYTHYTDVLFTTYGGVIEAPQPRRRLSGGPRVSGGPRLGVNTAPRMPAISPPPARKPTAPPVAAPVADETPAVTSAEKPASQPLKKPRRTLDILIFVIRLKIVAVVIAIIAYLVLSGILHF
jgi:hypothetical protein